MKTTAAANMLVADPLRVGGKEDRDSRVTSS
jgi:hypothetical protein